MSLDETLKPSLDKELEQKPNQKSNKALNQTLNQPISQTGRHPENDDSSHVRDYGSLGTPDYGNLLERAQFMDFAIHPLLTSGARISGPAFTVQLEPGDHLMMHKAIYEAPPGSIIVVDGGDTNFAVAGGNVCAVAQKRGIKGFVVDGVIRDVLEVRDMNFPVFAKGVFPVPGQKKVKNPLNIPINCGGVTVNPGDIVVADEEGIAVLPQEHAEVLFDKVQVKAKKEAEMTLEQWQANHEKRISEAFDAIKD